MSHLFLYCPGISSLITYLSLTSFNPPVIDVNLSVQISLELYLIELIFKVQICKVIIALLPEYSVFMVFNLFVKESGFLLMLQGKVLTTSEKKRMVNILTSMPLRKCNSNPDPFNPY